MAERDNKEKQTTSKADKEQFKRFAKSAKKVGLLVNREAYDRYFRERFSAKAEAEE